MSPRPSRVILHADDFGHCADTTLAIRRCIDRNVITSASLMANMPATDAALEHALQVQHQASIGVHLNLCEGRPLTTATSLVDGGGAFYAKRSLVIRALLRRFSELDIERECTAQIARVRDAGVVVSHVDGHKHLHLLPGIASIVARVARDFGITRVRCPSTILPRGSLTASRLAPVRHYMTMSASRHFVAAGVRHPHRLIDVRDIAAMRGGSDRVALITAPALLTEVMCHPGHRPPAAQVTLTRPLCPDADFLLSQEFADLLNVANVVRCTYWDC